MVPIPEKFNQKRDKFSLQLALHVHSLELSYSQLPTSRCTVISTVNELDKAILARKTKQLCKDMVEISEEESSRLKKYTPGDSA